MSNDRDKASSITIRARRSTSSLDPGTVNTTGTAMLGFSVLMGGVLIGFRLSRYLGFIFLVLGLGGIAFYFWQGRNWVSGYERAHLGQTERDIVALLGTPPRVTDGTEWVEPGVKKAPAAITTGCVKEFWYNEFLFPVAFSFCFDRESRLLNKYYWSSW